MENKMNQSKQKRILLRAVIIVVCLAGYIMLVRVLNSVEKTEMVSMKGYSYQKAVVTEVVRDNLTEDGQRAGYQYLKVKLLTGQQKGNIYDATSSEGNLFGAVCAAGDQVIVNISVSGDTTSVSVYSKDRILQTAVFIGIFLLAICVIGGKNGVKSVIGLVFTFLSIVYLFMPMIYRGCSPFWSAVFVCVITTIVTMYLIGGVSVKSAASVIGTTAGVVTAGIAASLFGLSADIDGYNVSNIETLVYVGQNTKIQIGGLLFAGILIVSLGAVMDVAMSVSSAICEIDAKTGNLTWTELFKSGLHVGRDMMGTMSNTLILAFVGGSLSTLVIDYAYNLPLIQLINSYNIGIEIMQGIAGSLGVILTVPFVALVTAVLLAERRKVKITQ